MPKFSEDTLTAWTRPASDSEETKLENSRRLVIDALNESQKIRSVDKDIFGQGSYANDTNVRLNSDIDINVCYTNGFYFELPANTTREDFAIGPSDGYSVQQFKNDVETALVAYFGRASIVRNNKCLTVKANTYRVETDVVATWSHRHYFKDRSYNDGVCFESDRGIWIYSYPKQHIQNGINKNSQTSRRFKRLTRIFKKLRYQMIADRQPVNEVISSFLLESLVWNVPNDVFNRNLTWTDRLREAIIFLYQETQDGQKCKSWGEVSDCLYLFHGARKWSTKDVNSFLAQAWRYLQYQ